MVRYYPKPAKDTYLTTLKTKHTNYLEYIKKEQDDSGFIEHRQCDALLFTGLAGSAGIKVDIEKSKDSLGRWHRRPSHDCYSSGGSKSTISRDMFIGLAWWCKFNKRPDILKQVLSYARTHLGIMGKGVISRTLFTPTMYMMCHMASNPKSIYRWLPIPEPKGLVDYQAHLQVLRVLLNGESRGWLWRSERDALKHHAEREPNNPLFVYAWAKYSDGDISKAVKILQNSKYWPPNKLPSNRNRSGHWLPERDYGSDWEPQTDGTSYLHSGGDFVYVSWLVLRYAGEK